MNSNRASPRIIIIDDDKALHRVFTRILQKEGYNVETAETGKEALEKTKNQTRQADSEGSPTVKPIVVDASVAAKWFFPEELAADAIRLISPRRRLLAPDLIWAEFGNVVWKRFRQRKISIDEAHSIIDDFLRLPLEIAATAPLLPAALELATTTGQTVYDCLYVALAISHECWFVTADRRLVDSLSRTWLARQVRTLGDAKRR